MDSTTRESGFSLLELVVSVAILTVIMTIAFRLMVQSQIGFDAVQIQAESHQNAEFAVHRVTEIIRGAGANPLNLVSTTGVQFIENPGSDTSRVRVKSDLDANGRFTDVVTTTGAGAFIVASEDVTIQHNATAQTLEIVDNNTTGSLPITIAENILDFRCPVNQTGYYPHSVLITIIAKSSRQLPLNDPRNLSITMTTQVQLRNL